MVFKLQSTFEENYSLNKTNDVDRLDSSVCFVFFSLGSFVEFIKIVPMLTQINDPDQDFVFEVIAPSIPGTIIKMVIFTLQCCQINIFKIFTKHSNLTTVLKSWQHCLQFT